MRIETTSRSGSVSSRSGVGRSAGSGGFFVDTEPQAERVASSNPVAQTSGIDALLALQAVEDPLFAKKKAVRRGNQLLDTLESIKADMLVGQVSEGRLNQLMVLIGQARERNLPGLDGILDDIELRARVELAKFGRYPAG
ncbi:MAG: flagellar assembly protein FliX [Devosia sp.]